MAYIPNFQQPWVPNYAQLSGAQQPQGLIWVDGEAAAKAYQMPPGWPANTPLALWDSNDTLIYLKSTNQMGMPNPLQIARYQLQDWTPKRSGAYGREDDTEQTWDEEKLNKMATKAELQELKDEIAKLKEGKE